MTVRIAPFFLMVLLVSCSDGSDGALAEALEAERDVVCACAEDEAACIAESRYGIDTDADIACVRERIASAAVMDCLVAHIDAEVACREQVATCDAEALAACETEADCGTDLREVFESCSDCPVCD